MKPLQERALTQTLSPEFLREACGYESAADALEACEREAQALEDTYDVVATAQRADSLSFRAGESGVKIHVIPKQRVDREQLQYNLEYVMTRLSRSD